MEVMTGKLVMEKVGIRKKCVCRWQVKSTASIFITHLTYWDVTIQRHIPQVPLAYSLVQDVWRQVTSAQVVIFILTGAVDESTDVLVN